MINLSKYHAFLTIVVMTLFWQNIATAQSNPYEMRIEPASRITYEPFSGLPGSEILKVYLELSDTAKDDPVTAAQQNKNRQLRLRFRTEDKSELAALKTSRQKLPIAVSPVNRPSGFKRSENEYHQDFRIRDQRLRERQFDFLLSVPESLYADSGTYRLPLVIELVDIISDEVLSEELIDIEVFVGMRLQANIAGTNSRPGQRVRVPVVDFGILKTGDSKRVSIQVRANTLANITVKSENNGRLRHTRGRDLFVDYSVNVDGESSTLEGPLVLTRRVAKTIQGSAYPMDITIGEVSGSFAGTYRDTITVEVRPQ